MSIVSRWAYADGTPQEHEDHRKLVDQLKRQAPELIDEWKRIARSRETEQARAHLRNAGVPVPLDAHTVGLGPLTITELNIFAHKATLALYFEHFRTPMPAEGKLFSVWRTKEDILAHGVPNFLLNLLPLYATMTQGAWDESKTFEYRHDLNREAGLFGCLVRLRRFFVAGFAVANSALLPIEETDWTGVLPFSTLRADPKFRAKR
jgi:hypothetical protein